ncbi:HlyD family efflux transporter periplasmic adaptor subunit [Desulfopila sp. IMCC35006]|uniref:HlyD family secretion protein n=1 Tax=Desulfopila sp. IMCC35006 TaxID=2569542 RepID=UPI0010ACDFA4|nr:HlyD family efflux transporter periplasmic adaptor subunit [Desulfopila sp. IMCC35006]TKB26883.1 HlyD family efflux transporter periplasmic adaptor subunit [Desulfopila sp. IMCC35006]
MNISYDRKRRDPTREGQMKVPYAPAKRALSNFKWRLTLLVVLSPFLYFGGKMVYSMFVAPSSGFVMLDIQKYQSPAESLVQKINVEIGQQIEAGDLLITLEDRQIESELVRLQAAREDLLAASDTDQGSGEYLLKQKKLALEAVAYQRSGFENISFLFQRGAATIAEKKTAFSQLNGARLQLNSAEHALSQWAERQQSSPERIRKMPEYRQLQEKIAQLEQEKMRLSVYSTSPGQVTEINVAQGQVLPKGEELIAVARQDKQIIASFISPNHLARVQLGEIADVVFPSGKVIKGRVQYNPRITGRLPAYLATPMLGRQRMVIVHLTPLEPIPPEESIDGLPVDVNFISFARQFIERVKNIFVPFS